MYDFNSFDTAVEGTPGVPQKPKKKDKYDFSSFDESIDPKKKISVGQYGYSNSLAGGGVQSVDGGEVGNSNLQSEKNSIDWNNWFKKDEHLVDQPESKDPLNDNLVGLTQNLNSLKVDPSISFEKSQKIKQIQDQIGKIKNGSAIPNGVLGKDVLSKITGKNPDNLSTDQINELTPNTLTGQSAKKSYLDLRGIKESFNNTSSIDEASIDFAIKNGDKGLELLRNYLGGNTSAIGDATKGEKLFEFLNNKNVQYLAQTDPKVYQEYKEALFNLPNHYPEYAATVVKQLISDKLEKNGDNNWFYNITGKDKADKIIDDAIKDGELPDNYKGVYENDVRPKLGTWQQLIHGNPLKTPGLLENVNEGAQDMLLGTGKSVAELIGIRYLYKSGSEQLSETVDKDYNSVNLNPTSLLHKTTMNGGKLIGAVLGMFPMSSSLETLGLAKANANGIAFGLGVLGDYNDQSKKLFPTNPLKQAVYTNVMTGLNIWGSKFLPGQNIGKVMEEQEPNIVATLKDVLAGKTPIEDGKQRIINGLVKTAKGSLEGGEFMAATTAADDLLSQTLQNKKVDLGQTAEKTFESFETGFLASSFLVGAEEILKKNKGVGESIYAMASNPDHFKEVITRMAETAPDFAKSKDDILANLDYISTVKKSLDSKDMNDSQKKNYIIRALNEKTRTGNIENITEPTLKKQQSDKLKKSQEINSNLLNGIPEEKTVENQAKKTVKELYDSDMLPKKDRELLEKPSTTEGGEPKYDEDKVVDYLDAVRKKEDSEKNKLPVSLVEAAKEVEPRVRISASELKALQPKTTTKMPIKHADEVFGEKLPLSMKYKDVKVKDLFSGEEQTMSASKARKSMEKQHNILEKLVNCLT